MSKLNSHKCSLFLALAAASLQAHAIGRLADVTVTDRDSGQTLPIYAHRGEYWVAGQPGARYAIAVRNASDGRVLAVSSVDGVNVVSGETAAIGQSGYVLAAFDSYEITGWRKSNQEVAGFEFSNASNAYASRTGRPAHVGVIGVALFEEQVAVTSKPWFAPESSTRGRRQDPERQSADGLALPRPPAPTAPREESLAEYSSANRQASGKAKADLGAPAAPSQESTNDAPRARQEARSAIWPTPSPPPATTPQLGPKLGTAHGERETSWVGQTTFNRRSSQPLEIIRIRYDSRANLLAMGVIHEPVIRGGGPVNPFPGSGGMAFVPDPPMR